jgi:hypothetical protein
VFVSLFVCVCVIALHKQKAIAVVATSVTTIFWRLSFFSLIIAFTQLRVRQHFLCFSLSISSFFLFLHPSFLFPPFFRRFLLFVCTLFITFIRSNCFLRTRCTCGCFFLD